MARFRCNMTSGGGGSSVKSGSTEATSRNNDIVIPTGLTSITRFIWYANRSASATADYINYVSYDSNIHPGAYDTGWNYTNAYGGTNVAINTNTSNCTKIASISGGTVTLHTPNNAYGDVAAGRWFAE